jgi:hypothetical protein
MELHSGAVLDSWEGGEMMRSAAWQRDPVSLLIPGTRTHLLASATRLVLEHERNGVPRKIFTIVLQTVC